MIDSFERRPRRRETLAHEGIITGLLGAIVVALYYLLVDFVRGQPLMTPSVLGDAFVLHRPVLMGTPDVAAVIAYTIVHVVAFVVFGVILTKFARASETSGFARYGVVQLLVAFAVFFYGVVCFGSEAVRGMFPFIGVLSANILAGVVMVGWLWRHHPKVQVALDHAPLGATGRGE